MTATDELRRLLDERGVEWDNCVGPFPQTAFNINGVVWQVKELVAGLDVSTRYLTPEQAVEATLGRGTCRKLPSSGDSVCIVRRHGYEMEFGYWRCSECGCECFEGARYCMGCGRKVVDA